MKRSLYKYTRTTDSLLQNLAKHQLRSVHYSMFNDPFECWCREVAGFPDPIRERDRFLAVIEAWGFPPEREREALESYADYASSLGGGPVLGGFIDTARISCFSLEPDNLLMWAHYGDGLRGLSIEIDEERLLEGIPRGRVVPVLYSEAPPVFDCAVYEVAVDQVWYHEDALEENARRRKRHVKDRDAHEWDAAYREALDEANRLLDELYQKMLATKPIQWGYEREARLIFHDEAASGESVAHFVYPRDAIRSVTFGEKMPSETRLKIEKVLHEAGVTVPIRIATRSKDSFRVHIA